MKFKKRTLAKLLFCVLLIVFFTVLGITIYLKVWSPVASKIENRSPKNDAQRLTSPEKSKLIVGEFINFKWKISKETVFREFGPPDDSGTITPPKQDTSVSSLLYRKKQPFGLKGNIIFVFHPLDGLVKGILKFPVQASKNCLTEFQQFSRRIRTKYPGLQEKTFKTNNLDAPFCNALLVERAQIVRYWKDPNHSSKIVLSLGLIQSNTITALVESPYGYDSWFKIRTAKESNNSSLRIMK